MQRAGKEGMGRAHPLHGAARRIAPQPAPPLIVHDAAIARPTRLAARRPAPESGAVAACFEGEQKRPLVDLIPGLQSPRRGLLRKRVFGLVRRVVDRVLALPRHAQARAGAPPFAEGVAIRCGSHERAGAHQHEHECARADVHNPKPTRLAHLDHLRLLALLDGQLRLVAAGAGGALLRLVDQPATGLVLRVALLLGGLAALLCGHLVVPVGWGLWRCGQCRVRGPHV
eukprot:COSAG04_NODE_598_length_12236_cov_8.196342_6_plen_228_part_00